MQTSSRYILNIATGLGGVSILYFLSLVLHLPFIVTALLAAAGLFFLFRWMNKQSFGTEKKISKTVFALLLVGVVVLTNKAYYMGSKHGVWDAWAIWNLNAKYLCEPEYWRNMLFNTKFSHPDYPLALPASIAFFSRLFTGGFSLVVAYSLHYLVMLCVPVLIYLEIVKKNILIAGLALMLLVTNDFYIMLGLHQLADTLLAFFFLCALVCMQHHKEDTRMLVLSTAFLGCCMWTKNEGVILAVIFALFHVKELFTRFRIKYAIMGFAIPFLTWLIFKTGFAPANDMIEAQGNSTLQLLQQKERYRLVYESFRNNLNEHFKYYKWAIVIYLAICALRRRVPDKRILMILTCMAAYLAVYIVSPNNLEWHLFTSLSRLMHQLMPVTIYVLALKLSGNGTTSGFQARFVSARQRLR